MVGCFGRERVHPLSCMKEASFEFLNERLKYHAHDPFTCDVMLFRCWNGYLGYVLVR